MACIPWLRDTCWAALCGQNSFKSDERFVKTSCSSQSMNSSSRPTLVDIITKRCAVFHDFDMSTANTSEIGLKSWCNGSPELFRLRRGPNYARNRYKAFPGNALYECVGVDIVEDSHQVKSVTQCLENSSLPVISSAGALPSIIIVNFQVPFQAGPLLGTHPQNDNGCNMIIYFRLTPQAASQALDLETADAGVRLLAEYLQEDGHPIREGNLQSKCLKAVGIIMNIDGLNLPSALSSIVHKFNGKPVLVERETQRYDVLSGRVVELAIDIRGFNPVARICLSSLHEQLRLADIQIGLTIQGCRDSELPEQLLGVVRFSGFDIMGGSQVHSELGESSEICKRANYPQRAIARESNTLPTRIIRALLRMMMFAFSFYLAMLFLEGDSWTLITEIFAVGHHTRTIA